VSRLDPAMTDLAATHPLFTTMNDGSLSSAKLSRLPAEGVTNGENIKLEIPNQRRIEHTFSEEDAPSVNIINIDAVSYVNSTSGQFDVIICDFPDPSSPDLAKLYSLHFYTALKGLLSPDGYLVQQSTSPYRAKEAFLCIGRTMDAAGLSAVPYHDHVPSFGEWGWWIASHQSIQSAEQIKKSMRGITHLPDNIQYLTPQIILSSLAFGKNYP